MKSSLGIACPCLIKVDVIVKLIFRPINVVCFLKILSWNLGFKPCVDEVVVYFVVAGSLS